jgi:hypothetical protein
VNSFVQRVEYSGSVANVGPTVAVFSAFIDGQKLYFVFVDFKAVFGEILIDSLLGRRRTLDH